MGDAPVLLYCSFLRNPSPKPTGVPEHCRERGTTVGPPFFGAFPSDLIPKATKDVNVRFLIHSFTFGDELIIDSALVVKKLL
jgi:hypothetical protein